MGRFQSEDVLRFCCPDVDAELVPLLWSQDMQERQNKIKIVICERDL